MSILIVNYEYPPIGAGAARASRSLAEALVRRGHPVVVMTAGYRGLHGHVIERGVHVYRLRSLRRVLYCSNPFEMASFLCAGFPRAAGLARKHKVDKAIVFFTIPCGPIGYFLKKSLGIPYAVSLRGGDVPGLEPGIEKVHRLLSKPRRAILRSAFCLVANSPGLASCSMKADPYPVNVIPNGVDTAFFHPLERDRQGGDRPFHFLFVGRFQHQKNLFYLLDSFAELRRCSDKNFRLTLVGDGPLRNELSSYAMRLGLSGCVEWKGWVERAELRDIYQLCDCMVNPSLYEGMPNTVLEAMACGMPVIASDVPGNDILIKHNETGFLFSLESPGLCVSYLKALLHDPAGAAVMGQNARSLVTSHQSWDTIAQKYLDIMGI